LTAGENIARNNRITDYARWVHTYRPGIFIDGVGNRAANNYIADAPHAGILLKGNDHIIEYNEIAHVCSEVSDAGAFYMGRDFTERGNVLRFNLVRTCGGPGAFSNDIVALYLDDCTSGTLVYGNIAYKCGLGIKLGGGRDNVVENNILVDCNPAIHCDDRGVNSRKEFFEGPDPILLERLKVVRHDQPPYSRRYPELADVLNNEPAAPRGNRIEHNIRLGGRWIDMPEHADEKTFALKDNFTEGDPKLAAPDRLDFRPAAGSPVWNMGFRPIPFEKIGLQKDAYRATLPEK
jgi:parallel beta-helix repeat protein